MVRYSLSEILTPEDVTLNEISEKCKVVDIMASAGNISSLLLLPFVSHLFKMISSDFIIYTNDVFLYAMDDVLELKNRVYIVVPLNVSRKRYFNGTVFNILSEHTERYYYDTKNNAVVFCYQVPDKMLSDYKHIINSEYDKVSLYYIVLCEKGGVIRGICTRSEILKKQWQLFTDLVNTDIEIVNDDRVFPLFQMENETYRSKSNLKDEAIKKCFLNKASQKTTFLTLKDTRFETTEYYINEEYQKLYSQYGNNN